MLKVHGVSACSMLIAFASVACGSDYNDEESRKISLGTAKSEFSAAEVATALTAKQEAVRSFFEQRLARLDIQETTVTDSGAVIDWLPKPKPLVELPPTPPAPMLQDGEQLAQTELQAQPWARGPEDTIPRVRFDVDGYLDWIGDRVPNDPAEVLASVPPPSPVNDRYHANVGLSYTGTSWEGVTGYINLWDAPHLNAGNTNIAQIFAGSEDTTETVEAGKIEYSGFNAGAPTLFVFYTRTGHALNSYGDWTQSYNDDYLGWVQVHPTIVPGLAFASNNLSVDGGDQFVWEMRFYHTDTKYWYFYANGELVGYYPACHNATGEVACNGSNFFFSSSSTSGIRNAVRDVRFYGEVFDSGAPLATSTDMGSGKKASFGFQHAAYIRTMQALPKGTSNWTLFQNASASLWSGTTDSACYSISTLSTSGSDNRFYYGGGGDEETGCN